MLAAALQVTERFDAEAKLTIGVHFALFLAEINSNIKIEFCSDSV